MVERLENPRKKQTFDDVASCNWQESWGTRVTILPAVIFHKLKSQNSGQTQSLIGEREGGEMGQCLACLDDGKKQQRKEKERLASEEVRAKAAGAAQRRYFFFTFCFFFPPIFIISNLSLMCSSPSKIMRFMKQIILGPFV